MNPELALIVAFTPPLLNHPGWRAVRAARRPADARCRAAEERDELAPSKANAPPSCKGGRIARPSLWSFP